MKCQNCGEIIEGIGFKCRHCGRQFCPSCRLPESHKCKEFEEKNNQKKTDWITSIKGLFEQEKKEPLVIYNPKPNKVSIIKTPIKRGERSKKKFKIRDLIPWIIIFFSLLFLFYKIFIN